MKRHFMAIIGSSLLIYGCNTATTTQEDTTSLPAFGISYYDSTFSNPPKYVDKDTLQSKVTIRIPQFTPATTQQHTRMNEAIQERVVYGIFSYMGSDSAPSPKQRKHIGAAAKQFLQTVLDFQKSEPQALPHHYTWSYEAKGDTLYVDNQYISVQIGSFAYTGGAHPNNWQDLFSFDRRTGEELDLRNMVQDTTAFRAYLLETFMAHEKKMAPEIGWEFSPDMYFLEDGKLPWPQMAFSKEGVKCVFSPYEVAPYVRGTIEFIVPKEKWDAIRKKK